MALPDLALLASTFRSLGLDVGADSRRLTVTAPGETHIDVTVKGGFVTLEWKSGAISLARKLVSVEDTKAEGSIRAFVLAHALRDHPNANGMSRAQS